MKYIKTFQHITEGLVAKKADKHDMKLAKTKSKVKFTDNEEWEKVGKNMWYCKMGPRPLLGTMFDDKDMARRMTQRVNDGQEYVTEKFINADKDETHIVEIKDMKFVPENIVIEVGDTIKWINEEGVHNVNGKQSHKRNKDNPESFGNEVGSDWTYSHTFTKPGKYTYHCDPHLGMDQVGTVTVR